MFTVVLKRTEDAVGLASLRNHLALVATELASNALKYGGGAPVTVRLYRVRNGWVVDAEDHSPHGTLVMYEPQGRPGGNGLLIVDTLSGEWGWYTSGSGAGARKHVWARVPAPGGATPERAMDDQASHGVGAWRPRARATVPPSIGSPATIARG